MKLFELDEQIEAYEAALLAGEATPADLERFLPVPDSEDFGETLVELLRITLEHQWQPGQTDALAAFRDQFPSLFADPSLLAPLAYEEYRLRVTDGQAANRDEYARRYGIDVSAWQDLQPDAAEIEAPSESSASWTEFTQSVPAAAAGLAVACRRLPAVGEKFGPFQLAALLGQGAFGKVFLARQTALANRYVALKITAGPTIEAERLARMQHGNIVPVYSVHRRRRLWAVCMPYLGGVTLAVLIARLKSESRWPQSAESLVATIAARQAELSTVVGPAESTPGEGSEPRSAPPVEKTLIRLASRPLEEVMVWILARVAAGLAHAHQRGIVHRDLKPANILISDDGEPLILDFNLAADRAEAAGHLARLGGTLPYMAPEQLASFQGGTQTVDGASDVYSLGVVLFESLSGEHPFPVRRGSLEEVLGRMRSDRTAAAPDLRRLNPKVSPGLAAIVARCLAAEAGQRYRDAGQLHEDLQRHLDHQPLRYARERSLQEVAHKWRRRHPRLTSAGSVLGIAGVFALIAGGIWMTREVQLAHRVAEDSYRQFDTAQAEARTLLIVADQNSPEEARGTAAARALLTQYHVLDDPQWSSQPLVRRLSPVSQAGLVAEAADLLELLKRRGHAVDTAASPQSTEHGAAIAARRAATELLISARGQLRRGERDAASSLETLAQSEPRDASVWMALGDARRLQGDLVGAEAAHTAAVALRGDLYLTWYLRGIARLVNQRGREAEEDFARALALKSPLPEALANRGLARQQQGNHQGAIDDFTQAITEGASDPVIYFARVRSHLATGDAGAAARDDEEGFRHAPFAARGWHERGLAHVRARDYAAAQADFRQAIRVLPNYIDALRNLAYVQAEQLGHAEDAIGTLTQLLAYLDGDVSAQVSRGVLYARLNKRTEATADAQAVLARQPPPLAIYQVACIYALLGRGDAQCRAAGLKYLDQAAFLQPGLVELARSDTDLANLRSEPRYKELTGRIDKADANAAALQDTQD